MQPTPASSNVLQGTPKAAIASNLYLKLTEVPRQSLGERAAKMRS
uniref:Uncharacterized protein n=1 Tax=Desertifilum tharense IPPAS B-1220 TaxID=1781255 RepID=A0ACD5GMK7_9CYAN